MSGHPIHTSDPTMHPQCSWLPAQLFHTRDTGGRRGGGGGVQSCDPDTWVLLLALPCLFGRAKQVKPGSRMQASGTALLERLPALRSW